MSKLRDCCGDCAHFVGQKSDGYVLDIGYNYEGKGQCTLNPQWLVINSSLDHFCDQHVGHFSDRDTTASRNAAYQRRHELRQYDTDQKARAIEAEKKLKAVRKELRELKKQAEQR